MNTNQKNLKNFSEVEIKKDKLFGWNIQLKSADLK